MIYGPPILNNSPFLLDEVNEYNKGEFGKKYGYGNYQDKGLPKNKELNKSPQSYVKRKNSTIVDINEYLRNGGTTLLIPENTRINSKHGNIVDEKTGYGIAITFEITERCSSVYYRKKIKEGLYCKIYYNGINSELNIISKKIINTNGFTNTCK